MQVFYRQHQRLALTGVQEELPQQRKGPRPVLLGAERAGTPGLPKTSRSWSSNPASLLNASRPREQVLDEAV